MSKGYAENIKHIIVYINLNLLMTTGCHNKERKFMNKL